MKIYYCDIDGLRDEATFERFFEKASDERKEKITRLKDERARLQCLGSDILIQHIANVEKVKCQITRNNYNKPEFAEGTVKFNVSHSSNYVVAVSSKYDIGIDVEEIKDKAELSTIDKRLMEKYYTQGEREYVKAAENAAGEVERFYEIWTIKEAFVKMEGVGIRRPFYTFEIRMDKESPYILENDECAILELKIGKKHILSVCHNIQEKNYTIKEIKL